MAINQLERTIDTALRDMLEKKASIMFDEQKEQMVKEFAERLEEKRGEIIASMALRVSKTFDVNTSGERVTVTINQGDLR